MFCEVVDQMLGDFEIGVMDGLRWHPLGERPARSEGFSEPRKLTVQEQAGLVRSLGRRSESPGGGWRQRRRLQLSQTEVAAIGPATAGTEQAALREGLIEENGHEGVPSGMTIHGSGAASPQAESATVWGLYSP
jgi:hypothetical protein